MKVRFERNGQLINEVTFPHAELPLGDEIAIRMNGTRHRFAVLLVSMVAEDGELKAVVVIGDEIAA